MSISHKFTHISILLLGLSVMFIQGRAQVGTAIPATSALSDIKPASVLIYPYYTSNLLRTQSENTKINLTNTHPTQVAFIHVFFVDASNCQPADMFVCLTANQTFSLIASEYDPDITGYFFAVAVDKDSGLPIQFNFLIGDYYLKLGSGHSANLGALGFAALQNPPAVTNPDGSTVDIKFDDVNYNAGPRLLAIDSIPSRADGNETMMILTRLGGDLVNGENYNLGGLLGLVYDDAEKGYSFSMPGGNCQYRTTISDNSPRLVPRFTSIIRAGHSGWIKIWPSGNFPVVGITLNYNSNANNAPANFNGGHNMHVLSVTTTGFLRIPIFLPTC